jgi:hypothetical protein
LGKCKIHKDKTNSFVFGSSLVLKVEPSISWKLPFKADFEFDVSRYSIEPEFFGTLTLPKA